MRERFCLRCKLAPDGAEGTYFCQECLDQRKLEIEEQRKDQKKCTKCGEWKEHSVVYFYTNGYSKRGKQELHPECKECTKMAATAYNRKNRAQIRLKRREAYKKNPIPARLSAKVWRSNHKEKVRLINTKISLRMKIKVCSYYSRGTPTCACCGEEYIHFLQLDHIDGGGNEHRRSLNSLGAGRTFYYWLVRNNFPKGYQILCANCHTAKTILGHCPRHNQG